MRTWQYLKSKKWQNTFEEKKKSQIQIFVFVFSAFLLTRATLLWTVLLEGSSLLWTMLLEGREGHRTRRELLGHQAFFIY